MIEADGDRLVVGGIATVNGTITAPGDKSISHRALICAALGRGTSTIEHLGPGDDVAATADALRAMGVPVEGDTVVGGGPGAFAEPDDVVDCRNSGTGIRLLAGLCAGLPFTTVLTGDASLRSRPMLRVVAPLREMGASITGRRGGDRAPLAIAGGALHGIHHRHAVPSGQVKGALMLAALSADAPVTVEQPPGGRDHTERMLRALGLEVEEQGALVTVHPGTPAPLGRYRVPGDISSAAFALAAAALLAGSEITVTGVGVNPTRSGVLDVLAAMGADVTVDHESEVAGEPVADVTVRHAGPLRAVRIDGPLVPRLVDEIPALAVLMSQADGTSVVAGAAELRVKETDRIVTMAEGLAAMGVEVEPQPDGFSISGPQPLRAARVKSHGDHRVAMALTVAGLAAAGETVVEGASCIGTSYPGFVEDMNGLCSS